MRFPRTMIGVSAVALLSAGCSSAETAQGGAAADAAKALPVAVTGAQPDVHMRGGDALRVTPAPEAGAPLAQKVEHALREDVLSIAKVAGETSAKCPAGVTRKAGAVSQCVVTYAGAEIPYEVKISDSYTAGSSFISYTKEPKKGLLVDKLVYQMINESYGSESGRTDASKLACDKLPAAKAFDFGADTGYKCQYWGEHADNGEPGFRTVQVGIGRKGYSYSFEEVE
ncbi:hypothetical protein OG978_05115 [Streptomyces sp. NBC_01591]|uniref:hypothetical protein n=1 Tax=Streptomyces sp. NBC_01591 TaxID=2975888 RepID=UPI002DDAA03F|nr:hypothetical protein [Streptomyces sp. NBC_01591]WSD66817.1 hypothetical protein OG978_05115 [Streptomyces sp. NBC_01591]